MKNFEFLPSGWTVVAILLIAALVAYLYWDRILTAGKTSWAKSSKKLGISKPRKGSKRNKILTLKNVVWGAFFLFWAFMLFLLGKHTYHFIKTAKPDNLDFYLVGIYVVGGFWTLVAVIMYFVGEFDSLWVWMGVYLLVTVIIIAVISFIAMLCVSFKAGLIWGGSNIFSSILATAFYRWDENRY